MHSFPGTEIDPQHFAYSERSNEKKLFLKIYLTTQSDSTRVGTLL